ncbi:MAG: hypothetical protein ACE5FA_06730 [Dehalococcoidia bacterium]
MMTACQSRSIEEVREEVQELRHQVSIIAADVLRLASRIDAMHTASMSVSDHPPGYDRLVRRYGVGK